MPIRVLKHPPGWRTILRALARRLVCPYCGEAATLLSERTKRMLIEVDDDYLQWIKEKNPDLFSPGQDEKAVITEYVNEVLASHHKSWADEPD